MLSAVEVRNAKAKEKAYKLTDGKGLFLHVATNGRKTWRYRFELPPGTESTIVLGEYPVMSLEAARVERTAAREMVKSGTNPAEARRQDKQRVIDERVAERKLLENCFENIAREWHAHQCGTWSKTHAEQSLLFLDREVFPVLGGLPFEQITPAKVLEVVRTIESRGALEIARKTLQRISAVCRYAVLTGRAEFNAAGDMKGVLKTRKTQHHNMIPAEDLPEFLRALASSTGLHPTTKATIQFTILTAARSGEVRGATWSEIDLEKKLWTIPAERMKMSRPHVVPLSQQAVSILENMKALHGGQGLIFPGITDFTKPLSENTSLYGLYRLGYHSRATMHGFRALFSTVCNEAGFNPDAIERQLAHVDKNAVRLAYNRSEYLAERAKLMQWWADHLHHLEHGAEIIPIGRALGA